MVLLGAAVGCSSSAAPLLDFAPAATRSPFSNPRPAASAPTLLPTPFVLTPIVLGGLPTATPALELCGKVIAICWTEAEQAIVAHICYEEARGLLKAGMASCAAAIALRHSQPEVWGGDDLEDIVRPDQFAVSAARLRPWRGHTPPPEEALEAVQFFLTSAVEMGCWRFDSFQASTPEQAWRWQARAPEKHCIVAVGTQAMLFFNWRDG